MSAQSELYNNYPANLPLLSLEELQALHDYNEKLIKTEAEVDLRLMMHQPVTSFSEVPSNTTSGEMEDAGLQWNSWNDRNDEITRALCGDPKDKKARWEILYEEWNTARRATAMKFRAEEQSSKSLCLDPGFQNADTTAIQHHKDQIRAMNALLHLQGQEAPPQQHSLTGHCPNEHLHVEHSPRVQPSIDQNSLSPDDATVPNLSHVAESTEKPANLAPGPLHPPNALMQYPQKHVSPNGTLQDHGAFRINLPSVSFLPQPSDGYSHPAIHFPSLTYIINTSVDDLDRKHHDSIPEHDQSQSQHNSKLNHQFKAGLFRALITMPKH